MPRRKRNLHRPGDVLMVEAYGYTCRSLPVPGVPNIPDRPEAAAYRRAYQLVNSSLKQAVSAWAALEGRADDYYKAAPSVLLQALYVFDPLTSIPAAVGYLASRGIVVDVPVAPQEEAG
jgi:hypothetical protein